MRTLIFKKYLVFFVIITYILISTIIYAGNEKGIDGVESILSKIGVGARALSLGNAYVALPSDATAIYWNPAGMEHVQKKTFSFYHTNLVAEGTQFDFVGYVHPTINFGTIGIGAMKVGVTGIKEVDSYNVYHGDFDHSQSQFLISYAKNIPFNLAVGISLKIEQWQLQESASGVGADLGVSYVPNFTNIFLRNISFGMNIKNALAPRIKLVEETQYMPHIFKIGLARPFSLSEWGSQFMLYLDFEQGGGGSGFKYHTGTEYVFQDQAMLRVGINNSYPAFGAGVVYEMFQLDYSYGKFAEHALDPSHRISLSVSFGKSKDEMIRIAEERKIRDIDRRVVQKIRYERKEKISRALETGKRFMDEEDYIRARQEFLIILGYEKQIPDAIEINEAKELLKFVVDKLDDEKRREAAEVQAREGREKDEYNKRVFINEHHKKALSYYEHEQYSKAIAEWNLILERYSDNQIAQEFVKKARVDQSIQIHKLIKQADNFARKQKYYDAIDMLSSALEQNPEDSKIRKEIARRKLKYEAELNFWDIYRLAKTYEYQKDYKRAEEKYTDALRINPNHKDVKKRLDYVKARANARKIEMKGHVKTSFIKSLRLLNNGKFQEALKILEEIQKIQPYNKDVLDAIDMVQEKINQKRRTN